MAKLNLPRYMIAMRGAKGATKYFWQPSSKLRAAGWRSERLSDQLPAAIGRAERINAALAAWQSGEGPAEAPAADPAPGVTLAPANPRAAAGTLDALILDYKRSRHWQPLRPRTREFYEHNFRWISAWAGDKPVIALRPKMVGTFYDELRARTPAKANAVLRVLRLVLEYGVRQEWLPSNPARRPAMVATPPRQTIWPSDAVEAFVARADKMGRAAVGDAIILAVDLGQRQGDVRLIRRSQYAEGRFVLRQQKTGKWIEVPATRRVKARLAAIDARRAAAIAAARDAGRPAPIEPTTLIALDGKPYSRFTLTDHFAEVRAAVAAEIPVFVDRHFVGQDGALIEVRTDELWFMDLRRTCVVAMAEAGCTEAEVASITGHTIDQVRRILEVYLPRTGPMAAAAIAKLEARRAELGGAGDAPAGPGRNETGTGI